jgi:type II secretory pathway pseudopilin PulG
MKKRFQSFKEKSASQALVVVLLAVTLLSIVIVGFLLTASLHRSVSRQDYQEQAAQAMAVTGLDSAITQIRTALGPWDDPFNNFCGGNATSAPPTFYWSTSLGIITRWSYTSTTPQTNYPLFSQSAYGDTNMANLNVPSSDGIYPIIGGAIQAFGAPK